MMTRLHTFPYISIIMPIRNEADFIAHSLKAVLAQTYPIDRFEVLIIDGLSNDETCVIIAQTIAHHSLPLPSIRRFNNPQRTAPYALNIGLQHACGDVIIRVDGHCIVATNYLEQCIVALQASGAACVGGPMETIGTTRYAQGIAYAQSSRFGVGGVAFRTGRNQGSYVDTLAFGAYRRSVIERIGGFDEELVRNQDDEFNFRLIQAGERIWLDPAIRSRYYSRASLRRLWQQYYEYGFYKVRVIQKRKAVASWRHLIPAVFIVSLIVSILFALVSGRRWLAWTIVGPYVLANSAASVVTARRDLRLLPMMPLAFAILHFAYGIGFVAGVWRWIVQPFTTRYTTDRAASSTSAHNMDEY